MSPFLAALLLALANPGLGGGAPPGLWILPGFALVLSVLWLYLSLLDLFIVMVPYIYSGLYYNLQRPLHTCYIMVEFIWEHMCDLTPMQLVATLRACHLVWHGDLAFCWRAAIPNAATALR